MTHPRAGEQRRRLSLWLEAADPAPLERWIARAARRHAVPELKVAPHLTLGGCRGLVEQDVLAGAARIAAGIPTPVRFHRAGFASSAGDRHRVMVVLAEAEPLAPAFELLRSELPQAEPSAPPHISLAYGDIAPDRCLAMLGEVYGPTDPMPDGIVLDRLTVHDTTDDDDAAWPLAGGWPLGS